MKYRFCFFYIFAFVYFLALPAFVYGAVESFSNVRVTYRPDGGVSVTTFIASSCLEKESALQCSDRLYGKIVELKGMPYEDMGPSELPKDEANRDKWRGEKGKGIWVDHGLVTKNEKLQELQNKLDEELAKSAPDRIAVARLERQFDKLRAMDAKNNILTGEQLKELDKISGNSGIMSFWARVKGFFSRLFK